MPAPELAGGPPPGAMPEKVLATLETLLAPGGRARLSPYVEAAQFKVLFCEAPDDGERAKSAQEILGRHGGRVREIAEAWKAFEGKGKPFHGDPYASGDFLDAYLAYYFSVNVAKVQLVLLDLVRAGKLSGEIVLLDIGVGTGTTAVATLDFLLAWGQVCDLHRVGFPVTGLRLMGVDRNQKCLDYAKGVVQAYAEALDRRILSRQEKGHAVSDGLRRTHEWAASARWLPHDVADGAPADPPAPNLVILANVLNELKRNGGAQRHLEAYVAGLPEGAIVVVIEPGAEQQSKELMRWRKGLIDSTGAFVAVGPCGQEFAGRMPVACDGCWNSRREAFHLTPLYRAFLKAAGKDPERYVRYDAFDNDLLSWSYVVLERADASRWPAPETCHELGVGQAVEELRGLRYIGTYLGKNPMGGGSGEEEQIPANGPAVHLKLCPAHVKGARGLAFRRPPEFIVPPLRYGQRFDLLRTSVDSAPGSAYVLKPVLNADEKERTRVMPAEGGGTSWGATPGGFLQPYAETERQQAVEAALDEIAHRLFGFVALEPFQHRILERVLSGRSILGIAATGSGKSECFILPAMLLPGVTVVVSPLKALMTDQYERRIRDRYGLDHLSTFLNGDVPLRERQTRVERLGQGYYKLVYVTPEQLEREWVLNSLQRANETVGVRYLALDEAHCISQWGHDFRPAYLNIVARLRKFRIEPVKIALTATARGRVRDDVCDELRLDGHLLNEGGEVLVETANRPELNLVVRRVNTADEKGARIEEDVLRFLAERDGSAIVFLPWARGNWGRPPDAKRRSPRVEEFASNLEQALNQRIALYHSQMDHESHVTDDQPAVSEVPWKPGDMTGRTRKAEQDAFTNGETSIMVATKGFGMGIDKRDIRLVVHRTPPANLEAYWQEAGRAGRDGQIANVILYYSVGADAHIEAGSTSTEDYNIQALFLRDKYIQTDDVRAMRAFLKTVQRPTAAGLYFTSDEAMGFFDRCTVDGSLAGLAHPYEWPVFGERKPTGQESPEHKDVLDRGYLYQKKSDYLDRILQALSCNRPTVGERKRVAFLESVQETGCVLVGPKIKDAKSIVQSNASFGRLLRDVTPMELIGLLDKHTLLPLAERLNLSVRETVSLVWDIKSLTQGPGKVPGLLDFKAIVAPRWGPAEGHETLDAWRCYAGARHRANWGQAQVRAAQRAKKTGVQPIKRMHDGKQVYPTTLDDWFSWGELNRSRAWEVDPGPGLLGDEAFETYLQAFMAIHDGRKENDWASFGDLLKDYVGVDENGQAGIEKRGPRPACLRAVLLGYLDTGETVEGSCLSCSNCEDPPFESSIAERRARVAKLSPEIRALLHDVKACEAAPPPLPLLAKLVGAGREEAQRGRAVMEYLWSWTSGRLAEQPDRDHQGALWLRLRLGAEGLHHQWGIADLLDNAHRVLESATEEGLDWLRPFVVQARTAAPKEPRLYELEADVCHGLGLNRDEEGAWRALLALVLPRASQHRDVVQRAYRGLLALCTKGGPLADADAAHSCLLALARLKRDHTEAIAAYEPLVPRWKWEQVIDELRQCEAWLPGEGTPALGVIVAWATAREGKAGEERGAQAAAYLGGDGLHLTEAIEVGAALLLFDRLGPVALNAQPALAGRLSRRLVAAGAATRELLAGVELRLLAADLRRPEVVDLARRLATVSAEADSALVVRLLECARELAPREPGVHEAQADFARRAGLDEAEARALADLVKLIRGQRARRDRLRSALERLKTLYWLLRDAERHQDAALELARLSEDAETASHAYLSVASNWAWEELLVEIEVLRAGEQAPTAGVGLLCAWATSGLAEQVQGRARRIAAFLATDGVVLLEHAGAREADLLATTASGRILDALPPVLRRRLTDLRGRPGRSRASHWLRRFGDRFLRRG